MTWRARIVTPWIGTGADGDANRPVFHDAGLAHLSWVDVTGQTAENIQPAPNAYTIEVTTAAEADLDAIAAHPAGFVELYREEVANGQT